MYDVGSRPDPFKQRKGGVVEEGETLVILGIAIYRITVKQRRGVDQEGRRPVGLAIERFSSKGLPLPGDPKVVDGNLPKVFAFGLEVTRRDQKRVDANILEGFRERSGNISEPARFGIGHSFGGYDGDSHLSSAKRNGSR
jgi:hypothetical protein